MERAGGTERPDSRDQTVNKNSMSYYSCRNPEEHRREGHSDFNRYGRYGYDPFQYNDAFSDCHRAYTDGFNEARREEDRRQEYWQEEIKNQEREDRRNYEQRQYAREMEEQEYYDAQQRDYEESMQRQMEADYYAQMQPHEPPIDEPDSIQETWM